MDQEEHQGQGPDCWNGYLMATYPVPFNFRVKMAPGASPDGEPSLWVWEDFSSYRRQSDPIDLNVGRADESDEAEAADSSLTLDLRDGLLSGRNPNSRLYGKLGQNTPIRYVLPRLTDTFDDRTRVNGWGTSPTGLAWSNTNAIYAVTGGKGTVALTTANTATGTFIVGGDTRHFDLWYSVSISAVTTGGAWATASYARYIDNDNHYRLHAEFQPANKVSVKIVRAQGGVETTLYENVAVDGVTYTAGAKLWVHAQATGPYLRVKVWTGTLANEPQLFQANASDGQVRGGGIGIFNWRTGGVTNAGTLTVSYDDIQLDAIVWEGNVPAFPPEWDKSGEDSYATIAAAGPLRRFNQGDPPVVSALTGQLSDPILGGTGHWPFEDAAGSTSAANKINGGSPAIVTGDVTFAADSDSVPGTTTMAQLGQTTGMRVTGKGKGSTGVGFAGLGFFKVPAIPPVNNTLIEWRCAGTVPIWRVTFNSTGMLMRAFKQNDDGTLNEVVTGITTTYPEGIPLVPFSVQLELTQSGSNIAYTLLANAVGSENFWVMNSGTVAGTVGSGQAFTLLGSTGTYGMSFGQFWLGPSTLPYVDADFLAVANGFAGELSTDRQARLFAQRGVSLVLPLDLGPGAGERLGAQKPGTFLVTVKDAARADQGPLIESGPTLGFLPRNGRYNPRAILTVDWAAGGFAEAPRPVDDDQRLHNQWTISRTGGSSASAQDDVSITRRGAVPSSDEVNIESDGRLQAFADWYTAVGSIDELRWPSLKLNLVKHPEYIPAVLSMEVGSLVKVINPKSQVAGATIEVIVEGINQSMGRYQWDVDLACSPATPWNSIGVYDDTASRRDAGSTTLNADRSSTDTSWVFKTANAAETWSTSAGDYPVDVVYEGEVVTVTAMGAVSGSAPSLLQTATVTRSVNGIVKAQTAGATKLITLAKPVHYGL